MGEFQTALSLWMVLGYLLNLGMDVYISKEIARIPSRLPYLLGTTFIIRTLLYGILLIGLAVYVEFNPISTQNYIVLQLVGLATYIGMLASAVLSALQGIEKMQYISLGLIINRLVNMLLCFVAIFFDSGLIAVAGALVLANLAWMSVQLYFLIRSTRIQLAFAISEVKPMIVMSVPYFVASMVGTAYLQSDVLQLNQIATPVEIGWYAVAKQLFGTLLFIAVVFTTVMFPMLTRTHVNDPSALPVIMRKAFHLMLVIAIPIGLGLSVVSQQLVDLVFGAEYRDAGVLLGLFGLVLIFMYFNILLGQYFTSVDRQNTWTKVLAISLVLVIVLNALFIPMAQNLYQNAAIGSALALLATEGFMCLVGVFATPRDMLRTSLVHTIPRVWLAGILMYILAYQFRDAFLLIPIIIGAIVYIGSIIALRVLSPEDVQLLRGLFDGVRRKFDRRAR
jgi:O-antigen/teichoic acid export membrane protein